MKKFALTAALLALVATPALAMAQTPQRMGVPLPKPRPIHVVASSTGTITVAATSAPALTPGSTVNVAVTPLGSCPTPLTQAAVQANPLCLLKQFSVNDLNAALADANAQTPPDTTSAQCYTALLALVNNPNNTLSQLLTPPQGIFSALQKARDTQALITNLNASNGPLSALNLACAPLVLSTQNTLIQLGLLTGAVTGVTAASGGLALPALGLPALAIPAIALPKL
jgi:hypothetical protein